MTRTADDFLAAISLIHRLLGTKSPYKDGLDAALSEGLDLVSGPVRLREVPVEASEAREVSEASQRVTCAASSRALSVESARASTSVTQSLEVQICGADANLFALLATPQRRLPLPAGATLANLRLKELEPISSRVPHAVRLRETEAYRVWDPASSDYHAKQTAQVQSGRLAFVRQGHGLLSLTLVGHQNNAPQPSREISILIRGC